MTAAELSRRVAVEIMGWEIVYVPQEQADYLRTNDGYGTCYRDDQIATDLNLAFEALWKVEPKGIPVLIQYDGDRFMVSTRDGQSLAWAKDLAAAVCSLALAINERKKEKS